jgi:DNA-binding MarR family transcriptional regulator
MTKSLITRKSEVALSNADYEALATLRYSLRKFTEFSTCAALRTGLPPQQHQALLAIKGQSQGQVMTVGSLADQLLIAPQTATELVGRLCDAGYVECCPCPHDRRRQAVTLTLKAENFLKDLTAAHVHEIREMAPLLIETLRILQDRQRLEQSAWMQ